MKNHEKKPGPAGPPWQPLEALGVYQKCRECAPTHRGDLYMSEIIQNNPETIQESSSNVCGHYRSLHIEISEHFKKSGIFLKKPGFLSVSFLTALTWGRSRRWSMDLAIFVDVAL